MAKRRKRHLTAMQMNPQRKRGGRYYYGPQCEAVEHGLEWMDKRNGRVERPDINGEYSYVKSDARKSGSKKLVAMSKNVEKEMKHLTRSMDALTKQFRKEKIIRCRRNH